MSSTDTNGHRSAGEPPVEATVRALTRVLDRALRQIERLDARVSALTEANADLARSLLPPTSRPVDLDPDHVDQEDADDREAEPIGPGLRSWLLVDDPARAAADLDDLCAWVWRIYLWWPDAALSSCWLWHPAVIEELWWLRVAHADAYDRRTGSSLRVADWHERHRPGVARRVRTVLVNCDLNRHAVVNNRPIDVVAPAPPAMVAYAGDIATVWAAGAGLDAIRAAGPEPSPAQLAEADAYQRAQFRRHR